MITHENLHEHLFHLYTQSPSPSSLGYISSQDTITQDIAQHHLEITQSISSFNNSRQHTTGTTGFVLWSTTPLLARWLLEGEGNPLCGNLKDLQILELGAGISGVLASTIGHECPRYVCTDQAPLLKLLRKNIENNGGKGNIKVAEFDWEETDEKSILGLFDRGYPDLIIACDTVYNTYLNGPFLDALANCSDERTQIIVAVHLRESSVVEDFLEKAIETFTVSVGKQGDGWVAFELSNLRSGEQ